MARLAAAGAVAQGIAPTAAIRPTQAFGHGAETVATTRYGRIRGVIDEGIHLFKGIPYGAPTGGPNRFMPPGPVQPWSGVRDALAYGPTAPQGAGTDPSQGEDCLVLNVWTPALEDGGRRPVMLWLHGGGFRSLSGSSAMYDGVNLCRRGDVVVLGLNHRLNVLGYLHLGDLAGERYVDSGNAGMLDIVQALHWIRDNIGHFGGDPDNVTIFGESGGGRKVSTLLAMPDARGLFHRAIIQSGPGIRLQPRDRSNEVAFALLEELGLARNETERLKDIPIQRLLAAHSAVEDRFDSSARARGRFEQRGFVPTVGVPTLPAFAFDPVATPISADIPILIGTNKHELARSASSDPGFMDRTLTRAQLRERVFPLVGEQTDRVLETYERVYPGEHPAVHWVLILSDRTYRYDSITLAERKAAAGPAPVYMYFFTWETPVSGGRLLSHHALEITFAFDNTTRVPGMSGGGERAAALSARMSDAWIAFARTGHPNTPAIPPWPAYDGLARATMILDDECEVAYDPDSEARRLWTLI